MNKLYFLLTMFTIPIFGNIINHFKIIQEHQKQNQIKIWVKLKITQEGFGKWKKNIYVGYIFQHLYKS